MIILNRVTARITERTCLTDINLRIHADENWVILGANGSGKTALGQLLCGQLEIVSGTITLPQQVASVAFEDVTRILEAERYNDDSNFRGGYDPGTSVSQFLWGSAANHPQNFVTAFDLKSLLDRGIKFLSTGEMRKVLICKALLKQPEVLILDEPFDGLDQESRALLRRLIEATHHQGIMVILLLNRFAEIPSTTTHIAVLNNGRISLAGIREEVLEQTARPAEVDPIQPCSMPATALQSPGHSDTPISNKVLIRMTNVQVSYRGSPVLNHFNWTVKSGEHWMISGANGSGKTTLLNLITGDNTQAYGNDLELFGWKKGSGESIWDIKRRIGYVSTTLQRDYRVGGRVLEVILSGFYDSIGLYRVPTAQQQKLARFWLGLIQLENKVRKPFGYLSFGEQRLVLIARAMIKQPELLLLDEPCQGLDEDNRRLVLQLVDTIALQGGAQILYVTHHPEDQLKCINCHLRFVPHPFGGFSAECQKL